MRIRSAIAIVSSAAMIVVQMPAPGFAQNAAPPPARHAALPQNVTPSPAIVEAFAAYPNGGDQLIQRISDIIVKNPRLAAGLVKHVQTAPLSTAQKLAAEQGLARALTRLGVQAADMPVKAPPPVAAVYDYTWLLALAALAGIICLGLCRDDDDRPPVSPSKQVNPL